MQLRAVSAAQWVRARPARAGALTSQGWGPGMGGAGPAKVTWGSRPSSWEGWMGSLSGDQGAPLTPFFTSELRLGPFSLETVFFCAAVVLRAGKGSCPVGEEHETVEARSAGPRPWLCPRCPASKLSSGRWQICQHGQRRLKRIDGQEQCPRWNRPPRWRGPSPRDVLGPDARPPLGSH